MTVKSNLVVTDIMSKILGILHTVGFKKVHIESLLTLLQEPVDGSGLPLIETHTAFDLATDNWKTNVDLTNKCMLPFSGMHIHTNGELSPCCMYKSRVVGDEVRTNWWVNNDNPVTKIYTIEELDAWQANSLPYIQQSFIDGNPPPGCSVCFNSEKEITSNLRENATVALLANQRTGWKDRYVTPEFVASPDPTWLDLKFGNYCNLKCIMCHPESSSQIGLEHKIHESKYRNINIILPQIESNQWWENEITFGKVIDLVRTARYISIAGGEPLLVPQLFQVVSAAPADCHININTNLTRLSNKHLELFNRRHHITIAISIDGIGIHNEYVRHGSRWKFIEENIQRLLSRTNIKVIFTYLLQHTSIYTFPNFWNFVKDLGCEIQISTINYDSVHPNGMMTINSVPSIDVEKFKDWYHSNVDAANVNIDAWLNMYQFDAAMHKKFKEYVNLVDEIRGCNFEETFVPTWEH